MERILQISGTKKGIFKMLDNVDITLEHAISAHEAGDLVTAGEKYLEILNLEPNHPDANHNFGLLCSKLGEPAMGVQFLRTAIETNPTVAGFWISIIDTLIEIKDVENAKIALEKAKEVGHNGEVFEKLEANIDILRNSKKESEAV